jgi:hypothetical protein
VESQNGKKPYVVISGRLMMRASNGKLQYAKTNGNDMSAAADCAAASAGKPSSNGKLISAESGSGASDLLTAADQSSGDMSVSKNGTGGSQVAPSV